MTMSLPNADGPCTSCSRRDFLARSAAAVGLAATAGCGDGVIGGKGITNPTGTIQIKVANVPDLAVTGRLVIIDGQRAAKRTGATAFVAFSRACTHEGTAVEVVDGGTRFHCFNHGSEYDANGSVLVGPATRNLSSLGAQYDAATDLLTIG
jgi:cytochrome b6-f complex iron-sulfur subunit